MSERVSIEKDATTEVHTHTRRIEFSGIEPQPVAGYSYKGKHYLPTFALATWKHGAAITEIKASGSVLKKDGTPGEQYVTVEYGTTWRADEEVPEWLAELFADSQHAEPTA